MQRGVDLVFADVVGERVHHQPTFLIPDVGFTLDQDQWRLFADFAGAAAEIGVELVFQIFVDVVGAVLFLHHFERGIFGERFGHHVGAAHLRADELVSPPLMA